MNIFMGFELLLCGSIYLINRYAEKKIANTAIEKFLFGTK